MKTWQIVVNIKVRKTQYALVFELSAESLDAAITTARKFIKEDFPGVGEYEFIAITNDDAERL